MRITLTSTNDLVIVDGATARVWTGHTEDGVPVVACIAAIGVDAGHDTTRFDAELYPYDAAVIEPLDDGVPYDPEEDIPC